MKDRKWKKLDPSLNINSQEEWDALTKIGQAIKLKNDAFIKNQRKIDVKSKKDRSEYNHNSIYWCLRARERYEDSIRNCDEYRDTKKATEYYRNCLEQAKTDFAKKVVFQKKYECYENLFFERTMPLMVSIYTGLLNGLIMDIRVMEKSWNYARSWFQFTDDMNWFDKLDKSCYLLGNYWFENIYPQYYKENFKETYSRHMNEIFEDALWNALKAVRLDGRKEVMLSLLGRYQNYRNFLIESGLRNLVDAFLKNQKLLGCAAIQDGSGNPSLWHDFKEFDMLKEHGGDPALGIGKTNPFVTTGIVFYENSFVNSYGIHTDDPDFQEQADHKMASRLLHQEFYHWTLYPTTLPHANSSETLEDYLPYYGKDEEYITHYKRWTDKNGEEHSKAYRIKFGRKIYN